QEVARFNCGNSCSNYWRMQLQTLTVSPGKVAVGSSSWLIPMKWLVSGVNGKANQI
ncbi:hypothetical protein GCK32_020957, partial [Trichostrongylus colubriformis]